MSPDKCFTKAKEKGLKYAGLVNGGSCYADVDFPNHDQYSIKVNDSECNVLCSQDSGKICGGKDRATVWNIEHYNGFESAFTLCFDKKKE